MPEIRIGEGLFFERGIDRIVVREGESSPSLPDPSRLAPSEHAGDSHLERLLRGPGFESFIDDALRPHLSDRGLLLPAAFRQALEGAVGVLRQRAAVVKDPRSREARVLQRAVRLLSEEQELRDLVRMYCSSLYQG